MITENQLKVLKIPEREVDNQVLDIMYLMKTKEEMFYFEVSVLYVMMLKTILKKC